MKLGILFCFMAGNAFCEGFTMSSGNTNSRNNSKNQRTSYKYFPSKEEDPSSDNAGAVFDANNSNETFQPPPDEKKKTGTGEKLSSSDLEWNQALQDRIAALQQGIGKRYVCKTQKGFLNVHSEPVNPYETANIVNQLVEGQVVTSTAPARGPWIRHDAGGWSISVFGGHTWLEPLEEDQ
jgi:hypothetical protein